METVAKTADNQRAWTIVSDDNCPVVRFLSHMVKSMDSRHFFHFVGADKTDENSANLKRILSGSQWSLLLIDDKGEFLQGPEAIPFILKNLPSGRIACVAYLIPGTMWLTRQLYLCISRNRKKIASLSVATKQNGTEQNAA